MAAWVRQSSADSRPGSALILTVVLTSLLAIVGVLFIMTARIERMATSATTENQQLNLAVETLVARIGEMLTADTPGVSDDAEYWDFPDVNDPWLADLEPYRSGPNYYWRQISRIADMNAADARDVRIRVLGDRDVIDVNMSGTNADADGDGVGDARWFEVPDIMSSRGKPVYAAVRIVDNSAMLNVNTGYWFDPTRPDSASVDGSSVQQINVIALAGNRDSTPADQQAHAAALLAERRIDPADGLTGYEQWVIWQYGRLDPNNPYRTFDLSDELELRYRFLLNHAAIDARVENWGRFKANTISTPVDAAGQTLDRWFVRARDDGMLDPNYSCRHVATTYNMDRIITPRPIAVGSVTLRKKVNVNSADENAIRDAIVAALSGGGRLADVLSGDSAQLAANLRDYIDDDDVVTAIAGPGSSGAHYYGFEQPCIYISEIAYRGVTDAAGVVHTSTAIELFKPYFEDRDPQPGQWRLTIADARGSRHVPIMWSGTRRFHVILNEDPLAELFDDSVFSDPEESADAPQRYGYRPSAYANPTAQADPNGFAEGARISLERYVVQTDTWTTVDHVPVRTGWMVPNQGARSRQRDVSPGKCVRKLWSDAATNAPGLGHATGNYVDPDEGVIQAHPANRPLKNIGELGMLFATSASGVTPNDTAAGVLLDLARPDYAELLNYLTVLDPAEHGRSADETRVMGRININTAPAFVIAQLPWMQYQPSGQPTFARAQAIVEYREQHGPFRSAAGLLQVPEMRQLNSDGVDNRHADNPPGPDITPDNVRDDLEERDLLFTRVSDLVTVRSDVFTAYILVRIGVNGPQKRMMAILDRSQTSQANPRVRLVSLYPIPDPR
ncbi:MAG TPA: helix-hairpin-helix domain-containing protein [Sedimentisphaerales bacterium]|nr:helix-hairpin-helix domain-containing protein [Sedimentisphaerales bacterium]HRS09557.1 helix-hairpin-helix domain-containing protein [Sedimentisphaerales bacterium]HRV46254.1 helix-hairpin-helix domain-containing protein [Sedimentisphaerales bacterium]